MTISAPVLAGQTLPYPRTYKKTDLWRSGATTTADGTVSHDLVNDAVKRRFEMTWQIATSTGIGYIVTAYAAMGAGPVTFVDTNGTSYSVTRTPDDTGLVVDWTTIRGTYYGSTSIVLIEV